MYQYNIEKIVSIDTAIQDINSSYSSKNTYRKEGIFSYKIGSIFHKKEMDERRFSYFSHNVIKILNNILNLTTTKRCSMIK